MGDTSWIDFAAIWIWPIGGALALLAIALRAALKLDCEHQPETTLRKPLPSGSGKEYGNHGGTKERSIERGLTIRQRVKVGPASS